MTQSREPDTSFQICARHISLGSAHTGGGSSDARTSDAHTRSLPGNSKTQLLLGTEEVFKGEATFVYTHTVFSLHTELKMDSKSSALGAQK